MRAISSAFIATTIFLTGCAASVQKSSNDLPIKVAGEGARHITLNVTGSKQSTESGDWEQFKGEWRGAMKSAAAAIGATFSSQEGIPQPTGQPGTLVVVDVADYRYISPGARYALGVMSGNAYVNSTVRFQDAVSGALLGERKYNTSSTAWQGIFSAMTEKQVQAICTEVAGELKAR